MKQRESGTRLAPRGQRGERGSVGGGAPYAAAGGRLGSVLFVTGGGGKPYAGAGGRVGAVTGVVGTGMGCIGGGALVVCTVVVEGAGFASDDAATGVGTGATGVGCGVVMVRGDASFCTSGATWAGASFFGGSFAHPANAIDAAAVNAAMLPDVVAADRAQNGQDDSEA